MDRFAELFIILWSAPSPATARLWSKPQLPWYRAMNLIKNFAKNRVPLWNRRIIFAIHWNKNLFWLFIHTETRGKGEINWGLIWNTESLSDQLILVQGSVAVESIIFVEHLWMEFMCFWSVFLYENVDLLLGREMLHFTFMCWFDVSLKVTFLFKCVLTVLA